MGPGDKGLTSEMIQLGRVGKDYIILDWIGKFNIGNDSVRKSFLLTVNSKFLDKD